MKGPSLDAIRKFKQTQERKKLEELERRSQAKLNTLGHRAAQGDRKAKSELKKIEKIKDEQSKQPFISSSTSADIPARHTQSTQPKPGTSAAKSGGVKKKPAIPTDFETLMKLAKQNKNEIIKREEPKLSPPPAPKRTIPKVEPRQPPKPTPIRTQPRPEHRPSKSTHDVDRPPVKKPQVPVPRPSQVAVQHANRPRQLPKTRPTLKPGPRRYTNHSRYDDDDDDDEYGDEDASFIDDDDYDDAREELQKTLKSVFRYDKRRCDLRESELDRQYNAIGRVSTFEDLEREERRAARLAAAEDAEAEREEEERKRLKKLRLNKHR